MASENFEKRVRPVFTAWDAKQLRGRLRILMHLCDVAILLQRVQNYLINILLVSSE